MTPSPDTASPAADAVRLEAVTRRHGRKPALDRVDLQVMPGEFVALLGPSGCGKTTLLRLVAGLDGADEGRISLAGRPVDRDGRVLVPAEARGVGMVFQSYALWPQMTVARNVAYALERARRAPAETAALVAEALAAVGLADRAGALPDALSGGQRQRVALARVLAARPAVVLMDEPLANLDPHLRRGIGEEIRRLHDATGAATLYVTHDQAEAMAMADRIAVLKHGRITQIDTPEAVYDRPVDAWTAGFVGQGAVLPVTILRVGAEGRARVRIGTGSDLVEAVLRVPPGTGTGPALAVFRPEHLVPVPRGTTGSLPAIVDRRVFEGAGRLLWLSAPWSSEPVPLRTGREAPRPGDVLGVVVRDGWVLPDPG